MINPRDFYLTPSFVVLPMVCISFLLTNIQAGQPTKSKVSGVVWIPGGTYWMGENDDKHPSAKPPHKITVDGFWMSKYEVTNALFAEFVKETKYKTIAELPPEASQLSDFAPKDLKDKVKNQPPFSIVFSPPKKVVNFNNHSQWWKLVEGADWQHPQGPKSDIKQKQNHPVVHICYYDAQDFCRWFGRKHKVQCRLPTEAEWEFAARGGLSKKKFPWGDELKPTGKWMCNVWQGKFPYANTKDDGYDYTSPVGNYPPNKFGLYDMSGNVWEWCSDKFQEKYYHDSPGKNPQGPKKGFDPLEPGLEKHVQRGGSFLCDPSYCERYLTYARGKGEPSSAADHTGFRFVIIP